MKGFILLSLICISQFIIGQPTQVISSDNTGNANISDHYIKKTTFCKTNFKKNLLSNNALDKILNGKDQSILLTNKRKNVNAYSLITLYDSIYIWKLDTLNNVWNFSGKQYFTYDANNNLASYLSQNWNGSAWLNYYQYFFTFDANNNWTSQLIQTWYGSAWVNVRLNSYTYDTNNNLISYLGQDWNDSTWKNYLQFSYTYDANNNQISRLDQIWKGSVWVNEYLHSYTYDVNDLLLSKVNINFNVNVSGQTDEADSTHYYFHTAVGVNELTALNEGLKAYPNPFSNVIKIVVNSNINKIGEAILFDALGKEIFREKTTTEETILNTENISPGFYLLTYTNGNKTTITKLLKF